MDFSGPAGSQISKLMSAAWTRSRVLAANVTNQNTAGGGLPILTGPGFVTPDNAAAVVALSEQGTR